MAPIPYAEQAGNFTFIPTQDDITNYPYLKQYGQKGITMPAKDFPAFMKDMQGLQGLSPEVRQQYEATLVGQLGTLLKSDDKMLPTYRFMVHDALNPMTGKPDYKRAAQVIDDIRKQPEAVNTEQRKQDLQFSDAAIQGKAKIAGAEEGARQDAQVAAAVRNIPDETLAYQYQQIKKGAITYTQAVNAIGGGQAGKEQFNNYLAKLGDPVPLALSPKAQSSLAALEPVLDSLKDFQRQLEPYKSNTQPLTLFANRLRYAIGDDDLDGLISTGEMDKIRGAGQSMTGLRSSLPLLDKAFVHTPNFWHDSGREMYDKVNVMVKYLDNQVAKTYKYGAKTGVVQPSEPVVYMGDKPYRYSGSGDRKDPKNYSSVTQ